MAGWEDGVRSREPSPEETAIRREEEEEHRGEILLLEFNAEERELLRSVMKDLLRDDSTAYVTFQEFLQSRGRLAPGGEGLKAEPPTGFYTRLGGRWSCAPNTIKNWLGAAMEDIPRRGRGRLRRMAAAAGKGTLR
jgi:hypothetical protein